MEDDFAWDILEKEFSAANDALRDPELTRMDEMCMIAEARVNSLQSVDTEMLVEECRQLNKGIAHLLERSTGVTGKIQFIDEDNDEGGFFHTQDTWMQFKGFIYSVRNNKVEFDYVFYAAIENENRDAIQDITTLEANSTVEARQVQARRGDVVLDFNIVHPVQAAAWLDLVDTDLVKKLDTYLFPEVIDAVELPEIDDPFNLITLNTIGELEIDLSAVAANERAFFKTLQAVNIYIDGSLSYDREVPHLVDLKGDWLTNKAGDYTPGKVDEANRLVIIHNPVLQKRQGEGHIYSIGFQGTLISNEPDEPSIEIVTEFKSTHNIRSLRQG